MHAVASIYTTTHDDQGTSRSYDSEDNESHGDYIPWVGEWGSSEDDKSRANAVVVTAIHVETETQRDHYQWDYKNGRPVSVENAAYMRQTMRRLQNGAPLSHETSNHARSEARRKVFRRLMLLLD